MKRDKNLYGGFFSNMNWVLNDAKNKKYDFCYFFEDDEQCIWLPNDYQKHIENIFQKCKDAHQIQTLFYRRIFNYSVQLNIYLK